MSKLGNSKISENENLVVEAQDYVVIDTASTRTVCGEKNDSTIIHMLFAPRSIQLLLKHSIHIYLQFNILLKY